jgi:hypothetical protein
MGAIDPRIKLPPEMISLTVLFCVKMKITKCERYLGPLVVNFGYKEKKRLQKIQFYSPYKLIGSFRPQNLVLCSQIR